MAVRSDKSTTKSKTVDKPKTRDRVSMNRRQENARNMAKPRERIFAHAKKESGRKADLANKQRLRIKRSLGIAKSRKDGKIHEQKQYKADKIKYSQIHVYKKDGRRGYIDALQNISKKNNEKDNTIKSDIREYKNVNFGRLNKNEAVLDKSKLQKAINQVKSYNNATVHSRKYPELRGQIKAQNFILDVAKAKQPNAQVSREAQQYARKQGVKYIEK